MHGGGNDGKVEAGVVGGCGVGNGGCIARGDVFASVLNSSGWVQASFCSTRDVGDEVIVVESGSYEVGLGAAVMFREAVA